MLELCRDLVAHKGHANAALLAVIRTNRAAASDPEVRRLLDHILIANRFWLLSVLGRPFLQDDESPELFSFDRLVQAYRMTQEQEAEWLAAASEVDLDRVLESALIPGGRCVVWQALMQVCLHSQGHRAQCAKLLRKHGGVPPVTDFIVWLAGRPVAEWADGGAPEPGAGW